MIARMESRRLGKREEEYFLLDITRNFGTKIIEGQLALTCSTAKEAKEYFSNMDLHHIPLQYNIVYLYNIKDLKMIRPLSW